MACETPVLEAPCAKDNRSPAKRGNAEGPSPESYPETGAIAGLDALAGEKQPGVRRVSARTPPGARNG